MHHRGLDLFQEQSDLLTHPSYTGICLFGYRNLLTMPYDDERWK